MGFELHWMMRWVTNEAQIKEPKGVPYRIRRVLLCLTKSILLKEGRVIFVAFGKWRHYIMYFFAYVGPTTYGVEIRMLYFLLRCFREDKEAEKARRINK